MKILQLACAALVVLAGATAAQCPIDQLEHPTATQADYFGRSLALQASTLLVGVPRDEPQGLPLTDNRGSVVAFEELDGAWISTQLLTASDGAPGDRFGTAIGLLDQRAFVSAPFDGAHGSVYVFDRVGSTWAESDKLLPTDLVVSPRFGTVLAVDDDWLLVGAPGDDETAGNAGAVYVFQEVGGAWSVHQKLLGTSEFGAAFGSALALDGARALVSAPNEDVTGTNSGAVHVFDLVQGNWQSAGTLPTGGYTVHLSQPYAFVGSSGFELIGGTWSPIPQAPNALFSSPFVFAAAPDGPGFRLANEDGIVRFDGTTWSLELELDSPTEIFTPLDSIAAWDHTVARGWATYDGIRTNTGIVQLDNDLTPTSYCTAKTNSLGCLPVIDSLGSPTVASLGQFHVTGTQFVNNKPGLLFYGVSGRAALPFLGGTLCVQPPLARTPVQSSTGNPPPDDCSGSYAFDFKALIAAGQDPQLLPGAEVRTQWYQRDPNDSQGIGLSNGLEFAVCAF